MNSFRYVAAWRFGEFSSTLVRFAFKSFMEMRDSCEKVLACLLRSRESVGVCSVIPLKKIYNTTNFYQFRQLDKCIFFVLPRSYS